MTLIFLFILGAVIGSFLNVCIYRMPRRESIIRPRSRCPLCKKRIPWYDNIPIISYILLRAKCRFCKKRISFVYPAVEFISAALLVALFLRFGFTARPACPVGRFFALWFFASALIVVSFIDLKMQEIPDAITLPGIVIGMACSALWPPPYLLNSFLGVIIGGGSIYILGFLGKFIFKREAMGEGDVKLLAMIGAFLGWKLAILVFFIAPLFGSLVGIALKIRRGADVIPYGPHLSLAAIVAVFYGEEILRRLFII